MALLAYASSVANPYQFCTDTDTDLSNEQSPIL